MLSPMPIQAIPIILYREAKGIVLNMPSKRRFNANVTPRMVARPIACRDSISGQPVAEVKIHNAYALDSSQFSKPSITPPVRNSLLLLRY